MSEPTISTLKIGMIIYRVRRFALQAGDRLFEKWLIEGRRIGTRTWRLAKVRGKALVYRTKDVAVRHCIWLNNPVGTEPEWGADLSENPWHAEKGMKGTPKPKRVATCRCGAQAAIRTWGAEGWLRVVIRYADGSRLTRYTCAACLAKSIPEEVRRICEPRICKTCRFWDPQGMACSHAPGEACPPDSSCGGWERLDSLNTEASKGANE